MTDYTELKSRLRNGIDFDDSKEAVDAIESLERQIAELSKEAVPEDIRKDADLEATIAEQAKQIEEMAEAVQVLRDALINHQKLTRPIEKSMQALALQPSPEILVARDQRVAEACARYVEPPVDLEDRDLLGGQEGRQLLEGTAEAIRAGKWREFL